MLSKQTDPIKQETLTVGGKDYPASYFGEEDFMGFQDFAKRRFWRLENAYDDFKGLPEGDDVLPYDNYPMLIEEGQVFVVDIEKTDGTVARYYYRSDGEKWQGKLATTGFTVD